MRQLMRRGARLYVQSAVRLALRLFLPRGGFLPLGDPLVDGFSIVRGTVGVLVLFLINAAYGTDVGGARGLALLFPPSLSDTWVLVAAPGVIIVLAAAALLLTRRSHRRRMARQLLHPVRAVLLFLVLDFLLVLGGSAVLDHVSGHGLIASFGLGLLSVLAYGWCLVFGWCAVWCCAAGPFRAGDGHPLLPAAASTLFAWVAAVHALVGSPPATMPHAVYFTIVFGGPATVTVVSGIEVGLLRVKHPDEFPFRDGPLAKAARRASPWDDDDPVIFAGQQLAAFGQQLKELGDRLARRNRGG
jgi:hypothetical protein